MKRVLNWGVFVLVLLGVYIFAGPTSLGGPASYVIVDGSSMEPTYEDGDLVIAYERARYSDGDVIVYDAPVDAQFNVIHRIIERTDGGFITQGDNRDEPDGWIAPDEEIYGVTLFHFPNGGAIVNFLRQPTTILAIGAGWVTLILMERSPKRSDRGRNGNKPSTGRQTPSQTPQRRLRRSNASVRAIDTTARPPRMSRTAKKAAERTARRRKRSTIAMLSLVGLVGASGGALFAQAATLHVTAGVLQVFQQEVDIEPPPPPEYAITVYAHFFDSSEHGEEIGRSPFIFEPVQVKHGQSYQVTWNGPPGNSTVIDCTSDAINFLDELPDDTFQGTEQVTPEHDADHLLCIQTAPGNVPENVTFEVFNGDGVEVELTPSEDESDGDDLAAYQAQSDDRPDQVTAEEDTAKDSSKDDDTDEGSDATDSADNDTSTGENYEAEEGTDENTTGGVGAVEDEPEDGLVDGAEHEGDAGEDT